MRPFFSYYGAKYTCAKHYGPPQRDLVIEPFAGSAGYSTYWAVEKVKLYDKSAAVVALWDWLIHCSAADVKALPDTVEHFDEVAALPEGPQMLLRFWVSKGRAEPTQTLSPWYFEHRNAKDCRVWGPAVKARILAQKPAIARWRVQQSDFRAVPVEDAHWHVDPPYANGPGERYPHQLGTDHRAMAAWAKTLPGVVHVCENAGARYLPFTPLHYVVTSRGRRTGDVSREVVYRQGEA